VEWGGGGGCKRDKVNKYTPLGGQANLAKSEETVENVFPKSRPLKKSCMDGTVIAKLAIAHEGLGSGISKISDPN